LAPVDGATLGSGNAGLALGADSASPSASRLLFSRSIRATSVANRWSRFFGLRDRRLRLRCWFCGCLAPQRAHEGSDLVAGAGKDDRPARFVQRRGGQQRGCDLQLVGCEGGDEARLGRSSGDAPCRRSTYRPRHGTGTGADHRQCGIEQGGIELVVRAGQEVDKLAPAHGPIVRVRDRLSHYRPKAVIETH
jgi:hypothetical protein